MGGAEQASPDGAAIPNDHARVGVVRQGQGLSQEEESRIHETTDEDLRNNENVDTPPLTQQGGPEKQQQQQPPVSIVRWERFLPVRTLKVLLVENDDSTRHVVSALLRNCSYEVSSAANGIQAWKILEDLTSHIDLVLTELVMPCLSGISLLDKIMSHRTFKNIPVVMMSSSDSMGTVFKCLSKGAVDFLVKPIRKNELKNLWQHVWRRCHSSSGSGSESGIQAQKSMKSKSADDSDNNSGSNDDDDNVSCGLNARDGSDNGSGTQSSWTKRAVEVESPQHDQLADPPDSTCAQVIHPKPETFFEDLMLMNVNKEIQGQKEHSDDLMGKDLEIGVPKSQEMQFEPYSTEKFSSKLINKKLDKLPEVDQNNASDRGLESKNVSDKPSIQAANLLGAIANGPDIPPIARDIQAPLGFMKVPEGSDKTNDNSSHLVSLELSLKRLRSIGDGGTSSPDDRNVLRRSDQSAFTRYHTSVASNQAPTGFGGSCAPFDNSSEAMRAESTYNMISSSNIAPLKQGSNSSNNINDMCSTAKNVFTNPMEYNEKTTSISAGNCIHPSSAFHPVQLRASTTQQNIQEKAEEETADMMIGKGKSKGIQPQVQVEHHHHHYHHHHLHIHNMQQQQQQQQQQPQPDNDGFSLNDTAVAPECGSSDKFVPPVEGNAANYSVIWSNSSSNHSSNGHNGSSPAVKVGELNTDSVNGTADHIRSEGGHGSGSGSGVEQQQSSRREAALKKFRQKRKERNFGKKVRYQTRKRLAEQRPRVRGQFVRQNVEAER